MFKAFLNWRRARIEKFRLQQFDTLRARVINGWAIIEMIINQANHYAWRYTKKEISAVVPLNLGRKLELFKRIHRKVIPFQPLQESADELSRLLDGAYEVRHWLAHGVLQADSPDLNSWTLRKDQFNKDGSITNVERTFTIKELTRFLLDLSDLANKMTVYCYALADQVEKHPLRH
jgi:hypothetical protein